MKYATGGRPSFVSEAAYNGLLFTGGLGNNANPIPVNGNSFTTKVLDQTATPIACIHNPPDSTVNAHLVEADISLILTALVHTTGSPYIWCWAVNQALTGPSNPIFSRRMGNPPGQVLDYSGQLLTGLTGTLSFGPVAVLGGGAAFTVSVTDAGTSTPWHIPFKEEYDGSMIVPPGGVLALMATNKMTSSALYSNITWAEFDK